MPATITSQFRINNALALVAKAKPITATASGSTITYSTAEISNTPLWIGIGKTDSWPVVSGNITVKTPNSSLADSNGVLANLITLNQVIAAELMFPANLWQSNRVYKAYDSGDDGCFYPNTVGTTTYYPCYVNLSDDKIYLCVRTSGAASNAIPTGTVTGAILPLLTTSPAPTDGYYWAYLYTIAAANPGKLNTTTFKPLTSPTNTTVESKGIFLYAQPIDPITGLSIPAPSLTNVTAIILHWTGIFTSTAGVASASGGAISIFATSPSNRLDYVGIDTAVNGGTRAISYASITVTMSSGTSLAFRPVITPAAGIVSDLTKVLPCWYAGFVAEFNGADTAAIDLIKTNNYSQISLINNPGNTDGGTAPLNSKNCLRYFVISSSVGWPTDLPALNDILIYQCSLAGALNANGAIGIIDYAILSGLEKRVYFHQNLDVKSGSNMNMFLAGGATSYINIGNATAPIVYTYSSIVEPEYKRGTGEVLFLENRSEISRAANQSEVIKIIIQL